MDRAGIRPSVWGAVVGLLTAAAVVAVMYESRRPAETASETDVPAVADETAAVEPETSDESRPAAARSPVRRPAAPQEPVPYIENLVWGDIDLREAQAVMPDNLYWKWGAPTSDPDEIAAREEEKKRRNEEYGRVLSGDADETAVDAYYDYRERLSADYLEFAQWMRHRYGDGLSEEFRGLLDLSIKLNAARLAQIAGDRVNAREHSRTRAEIRADWLSQQKEFGALERDDR
jgi:hypothetical protein